LDNFGKFGKRHQGAIVKLFNGKDVYYHSLRDHKSPYFLGCCSIQRFGIRYFVNQLLFTALAISLLTSLVQDQFAFSTRQWEMEQYLSVFVTNEAKNTQKLQKGFLASSRA